MDSAVWVRSGRMFATGRWRGSNVPPLRPVMTSGLRVIIYGRIIGLDDWPGEELVAVVASQPSVLIAVCTTRIHVLGQTIA